MSDGRLALAIALVISALALVLGGCDSGQGVLGGLSAGHGGCWIEERSVFKDRVIACSDGTKWEYTVRGFVGEKLERIK